MPHVVDQRAAASTGSTGVRPAAVPVPNVHADDPAMLHFGVGPTESLLDRFYFHLQRFVWAHDVCSELCNKPKEPYACTNSMILGD